ncbi:MAG: ATP-binding protein [Candidatus Thermoplasmatota archaeon]
MANPFMRSTGNPPRKFVGRELELSELMRALDHTKAGMPEHTIMFGQFGIGKTSLLIEFRARAKDVYAVRIPLFATGDISEICDIVLREARSQLDLKPQKLRGRLVQFGFTVFGTGASLTLGKVQMNPQSALKEILATIHHQLPEGSTLVLMLDDLHRITGEGGMDARKVFTVLSNVLLQLNQDKRKIMFVGTGSHDILRIIRAHDEASVRIFHPQEVPPLSLEETRAVIREHAKEEGAEFSEEVITKIHELSEGIPYYIHILSYYCFEAREDSQVRSNAFERGFPRALNDLAEKEFETMYKGISNGAKRVLAAMVESRKRTLRYSEIKRLAGSEVSVYLSELNEKNLIVKDGRGKYRARDRLFAEYLHSHKPYMRNGTIEGRE